MGSILSVGLMSVVAAAVPGAGPAAAAPSASVAAQAAALGAGGFDFTRPSQAASGLSVPWGLAFLPDGTALVGERGTARLLRVRAGEAPQVVGTVPGVSSGGEAGLLGLAVSPTYAQDRYVYAYFSAASDNRIVRFRLDALREQQVVLSGIARANIHNGGRIAFGPDGMLYAGVGDAANTSTSQNRQSLNGKILRMTPTGGVPADNPFGNHVYSYGHRNVQGLAWDDEGNLYATEFGQSTFDEVNRIVAGGNYGWPVVEGTGTNPAYRNPLVVWRPSEASPSGAAYANGHLFAAALRGSRLWAVPLTPGGGAGTPVAELRGTYGRLRSVALGPDGWLWVTTSNRDGSGSPGAADDRILRFPPLADPQPGTVYADDFEATGAWTTNAAGTDTATTGRWERADPEATTSGGTALQPGAAAGGANALVTGAAAGTSAGAFDVDGGVTSSDSPSIALPATGTLTLTFAWYLAHRNNATTVDGLRVSVVDGTTATAVFAQDAAATNRAGTWATATVDVSRFAGRTIRLRVAATDGGSASLVEAGLDDVRITRS